MSMAVEIPLTQGKVAIISPEDEHWVREFRWTAQRNSSGIWYARARILGWTVLLHRAIMGLPDHLVIDHINDNGLDNRRENLRLCTPRQNAINRRGAGPSGYKGVYRAKNMRHRPWVASIRIDGQRTYLGAFTAPEDAARAYDAAALEHHGEFARLNFPARSRPPRSCGGA